MKKIRFLTFTDVHISDVNPSARLGSYKRDIIAKLKQIGAAGKKLGVNFYIFAGDLYHIKSPIKNTHHLNTLLTETFQSFGAPIYATEGNHDLRGSYENFDEQPLKVLYTSGTLKQLREEKLDIDGIKILLRGFPFKENEFSATKIVSEDFSSDVSVCALHLYATPTGGNLFKTKLFSYKELSESGDSVYVLGHYHIDQGIETVTDNGYPQYFVNVGAISRGTTSEDNIKRDPKIGYVEITKDDDGKISIKVQAVKLKVKPSDEVFDLVEKESEKEKISITEQFVEKLQKNLDSGITNSNTIDDEVNNLEAEKEIIDSVKYYLEQADLYIKELTK
jgi:DNA repair exonuclease SbcCD nuclease subunit